MNWKVAPFNYKFSLASIKENEMTDLPKPKNFEQMKDIASKLSNGFDFVRVDLYDVPDRGIVFGEWTFALGGASERGNPMQVDFDMGKMYAEAKKERLKAGWTEEKLRL